MKCEEFRNDLDAFEAGEVHDTAAFERHVAACPACQRYRRDVRRMKGALATLPAGEENAATAWMRAQRRALQRRARRRSAALASAATVAAIAVGVLVLGQLPGTEPGPTEVAAETRTLTVSIDSPRAKDNVHFRVELPEGVELDGYPQQRVVEWRGRLEEGSNRLRLPVRPINGLQGEIVTRVEHEGRGRELRLALSEGPES